MTIEVLVAIPTLLALTVFKYHIWNFETCFMIPLSASAALSHIIIFLFFKEYFQRECGAYDKRNILQLLWSYVLR